MKRIRIYLFVYFTATTLLEFAYRTLDRLTRGNSSNWQSILIEQATGVYGIAVLLPLIFWALRRFPLGRSLGPLLQQALCLACFSILHTLWNWGARVVCFSLFGLGNYDYGRMPLRFFMELPVDVIAYALAAGAYTVYQNWLRTRNIETELALARLDSLTRQLHPHFIFNALNAVSNVMHEDVTRADGMLEQLSAFLRTTMRLPDSPLNSISNEVALARQYLEIMQTRLESRLEYSISCDSTAAKIEIPTLLLQPLLENAVEHGKDPHTGMLRVHLDIRRLNRTVQIAIRDCGSGPQSHIDGQGLSNTKKRLETYYGGKATFHLDSHSEGGALVELDIPV